MIYFGYAIFGLLLGYITGLTETDITKVILASLFAFIGGKLFTEIKDKSKEEISRAGGILVSFSMAFIISLNIGIYIKLNDCFYKNPPVTKGQKGESRKSPLKSETDTLTIDAIEKR